MSPQALDFPRFQARAPWWGPDLQTLRNSFRGPALPAVSPARRERLHLALPSSPPEARADRLAALLEEPPIPAPAAPLVVLIHGLGGDETSTYLQTSASHLLANGLAVLRLNLRGAGPSRPLCHQQYHAGRTEDLRDALAGLPADRTRNGLVLVGFSLGGNMLLKFLAEHGAETEGLLGAVSISAPIDLRVASRRILEPRNVVYHRHLLTGMKTEALAADSITDAERALVPTLESIVDFDERLVAPRNGFAGADDYYARNHARQFLPEVRVKTLVIHALDDPWIPAESYTSVAWHDTDTLTPLLPGGGGHVGFHADGSRVPWHDQCTLRFVTQLAREGFEAPALEGLGAA